MTAVVMAGAPVSDAVLGEVGDAVAKLGVVGKTVGLGTILVGDDPASAHYVARKHETCERYGIASVDLRIPATATQEDLLEAVDQLNHDPGVDGFLVQNPVPAGFDYAEALTRVLPSKDVDGFNPKNAGLLAVGCAPPRGPYQSRSHFKAPRRLICGRASTKVNVYPQSLLRSEGSAW